MKKECDREKDGEGLGSTEKEQNKETQKRTRNRVKVDAGKQFYAPPWWFMPRAGTQLGPYKPTVILMLFNQQNCRFLL